MDYQWDWSILLQLPYRDWLWTGLGWTVLISLGSWALALVLGTVFGALRSLPNRPLQLVGALYVEVFRNIPALVQLFLWYFVVPNVVPNDLGMWLKRGMPHPEVTTAIIAIGLFSGARVAEQVRAGIEAVGIQLLPAALATGLRPVQAFRLILFPLGLRAIIAPLTSEFLITVKMSSISLTIGVLELTGQSRQIENYTFHGLEAFAAATVAYLLLGLCVTGFMRFLNARFGELRQEASEP
ncbi:MAG TPA: amino acid ABC transporter permease [Castellaniella sp.]|uniref:amino acid ABC transporter permease n=1 Tax=Castellaniella sp. TaxID=1955812 RepID=UPI002F100CED